MWGMLALAVLVAIAFIYVPGTLLLRSARIPRLYAVACAPMVTVAVDNVLFALLGKMGIACNWMLAFFGVTAVALAIWGLARFFGSRRGALAANGVPSEKPREGKALAQRVVASDAAKVALYVLGGLAVTAYMFLSQLGGPEAFIESIDNVHHLGSIRACADSGMFSSLGATLYLGADVTLDPFVEGGYYPSAWHALGAMLVQALSVPVTLAANAVNVFWIAIVYPVGMYALMRYLLPRDGLAHVAGSLLVLASASGFWILLTWGPLFSNIMAYSMLPTLALSFLVCLAPRQRIADEGQNARSARVRSACVFLVGVVAAFFAQPNTVFSAGVLVAPYIVQRSFEAGRAARSAAVGAIAAIAACLAIAVVWYTAFKMPFMKAVVEYNWPPDVSPGMLAVELATLGLRVAGSQVVLAVLVVIGIVRVFSRERHLICVVAGLGLALLIYAAAVGIGGFWHQLLAGFWYTDAPRISAFVSMPIAILAAIGLGSITRIVRDAVERAGSGKRPSESGKTGSVTALAVSTAVAALFVAGVYAPYGAPAHDEPGDLGHAINVNSLAVQARHVAHEYDNRNGLVYDSHEQDFVEQALSILPADAVVVNNPGDGSAYAYGTAGMRLYYRYWRGYGEPDEGEKPESVLIRERLAKIASDGAVREAVRKVGAGYVLQLDQGHDDWWNRMWTYDGSLWHGIEDIRDDTPGFEVLLAQGEMRLYRISVV